MAPGPEGFWPENQGFDINKGGCDRGGPYGGNKYFSPYGNPRCRTARTASICPTGWRPRRAKFIEANKDRPFLAYLRSTPSTSPLMAREDLKAKYEEKAKAGQARGSRLGQGRRAAGPAGAGSRRLRGHGRGDGPGRGQGARRAGPAGPGEGHRRLLHVGQRRALDLAKGTPRAICRCGRARAGSTRAASASR